MQLLQCQRIPPHFKDDLFSGEFQDNSTSLYLEQRWRGTSEFNSLCLFVIVKTKQIWLIFQVIYLLHESLQDQSFMHAECQYLIYLSLVLWLTIEFYCEFPKTFPNSTHKLLAIHALCNKLVIMYSHIPHTSCYSTLA